MGQGSGISVSCGVGQRWGLDPALAVMKAGSCSSDLTLAWEFPYVVGAALKKKKKKKQKKKKRERILESVGELH